VAEYRIDDLARAAGASVRNVRVYQDRGLLPPPRREGRVGWYSEAHLARLRLIGRLLERGFTFAHIGELLSAWEQGRNLAEVLGLEEVITAPWSDEQAERISAGEVRRLFGRQGDRAAVARAVALGLLRRDGTGFLVRSPRLLRAGAELVALGIPLPTVLDLAAGLQNDAATIAARLVRTVMDHLAATAGPDGLPVTERVGEVVDLVARLRPHAQSALDAVFAAAMEDQVTVVFSETARVAAGRQEPLPPLPPTP
jgi:DNA-binding transcriptional MerR regulator